VPGESQDTLEGYGGSKLIQQALYTYQYAVVVRGNEQFADARPDTLLDPTLIIEVLSDSTETYHRCSGSSTTANWNRWRNMY
jgi:hypothetical protein